MNWNKIKELINNYPHNVLIWRGKLWDISEIKGVIDKIKALPEERQPHTDELYNSLFNEMKKYTSSKQLTGQLETVHYRGEEELDELLK